MVHRSMKLQTLLNEISVLIDHHGPNSDVAAFIFTENDVKEISTSVSSADVLNDFMHHHTTAMSGATIEDFLLEEFQSCVGRES